MGDPSQTGRREFVCAAMASVLLANLPRAYAHPVSQELVYTRYRGSPNIKKVRVRFDGEALTLGEPEPLGDLKGADGIVFTPDGHIVVSGQGNRLHRLRADGTRDRSVTAGGGEAFHLVVDPDGSRIWTSSMPGRIVEVPLEPFADGRLRVLKGDDEAVTGIAFDVSGRAFYTTGGYLGGGNFGSLDFNTMATRRLIEDLEAAHAITHDPFTGDLFLFGGDEIAQIDPSRPHEIKSSRKFRFKSRLFRRDAHFDQGSPDGRGHLFVGRTSGDLLFMDYAVSGLIGHRGNLLSVVYLDSYLDDIALPANQFALSGPAGRGGRQSPPAPGEGGQRVSEAVGPSGAPPPPSQPQTLGRFAAEALPAWIAAVTALLLRGHCRLARHPHPEGRCMGLSRCDPFDGRWLRGTALVCGTSWPARMGRRSVGCPAGVSGAGGRGPI